MTPEEERRLSANRFPPYPNRHPQNHNPQLSSLYTAHTASSNPGLFNTRTSPAFSGCSSPPVFPFGHTSQTPSQNVLSPSRFPYGNNVLSPQGLAPGHTYYRNKPNNLSAGTSLISQAIREQISHFEAIENQELLEKQDQVARRNQAISNQNRLLDQGRAKIAEAEANLARVEEEVALARSRQAFENNFQDRRQMSTLVPSNPSQILQPSSNQNTPQATNSNTTPSSSNIPGQSIQPSMGNTPSTNANQQINAPNAQNSPVITIDWEARNREAETRNLAIAMAASLRENEEKKDTELSLKDQSLSEISAHFGDSPILKEFPSCKELMRAKGASRDKMIDILNFERQSIKWYPGPGTSGFFKESVITSKKDAKIPAKPRAKKGGSITPPTTAKLISFMNSLSGKMEKAKVEVFAMPTDEIPALFRGCQEVESSSDVEILEETLPAKKKAKTYTIDLL